MKIVIGADPFAYSLKKALIEHLKARGVELIDADNFGDTPYYEVGEKAAKLVAANEVDGGVLLCGTGAGMSIVANKVAGAYAVCVESVFAARKAKAINNANIITMGAMIVGGQMACEMVDAWLDTKFAEGFESLREFLDGAYAEVAKIDLENRRKK